ncbi:CPBP family intramembrane metalloprotease [Bacillus cereus]|nr:CPBP family intramembrane metalloprotease [Bacillus cereus]PGP76720.1 CPBP family intramembrane metalloprotease [Bacillus cereus]
MSYGDSFLEMVAKACCYVLLSSSLFMLMYFGDGFLELGLSGPDGYMLLYFGSWFLGALIYRPIRGCFESHFIKERKIYLIIGLPIILGFLMQAILSFVHVFCYWLTGSIIPVGSNQYISSESLSAVGEWIKVCLLSPFIEELLLRYITYIVFFWLLDKLKDKSLVFRRVYDGSEDKKKKFIYVWLLVSSYIFALGHGVNIINMWFYFLPGIVYGVLFIRYGFLASWISHSIFNIASKNVHKAMMHLFGM